MKSPARKGRVRVHAHKKIKARASGRFRMLRRSLGQRRLCLR
jgi:hypothetical protein